MKTANPWLQLSLLICVALASVAAAEPVITPEQIEADWLLQEAVRHLPAGQAGTREATRQDAAGAVDGVKNGRFGFHTRANQKPWWQVDLGKSLPLDRVVIFNRCDGNVQARTARIMVLLSDDGQAWTQAYQHDGTEFFGQTDGRPLSVSLGGAKARFVRLQLPLDVVNREKQYFCLDEVEVYRIGADQNIALHRPADQSSYSQWSTFSLAVNRNMPKPTYRIEQVVQRGLKLADDLRQSGVDVDQSVTTLQQVAVQMKELSDDAPKGARRELYMRARWAVRRMTLANPLLDFDDLLLVKRAPGSYTHMSDQYFGWFSRPGGGLYIMKNFRTDNPSLHCLTDQLPEGSIIRPDISYDGKRVLFAHCKHYPGLADEANKLDKSNVPEDAFYHLYEMNLDGTGLRQLTHGKYDDFDGRYLPDGRIVFLSTRRGQYVQCTTGTALASLDGQNPDSYVRCGGGPERPVAVYTLHVMDTDGKELKQISPFEMFEWTPSIDEAGRIIYARWDYVDRYNMPYMSLWSTMPDGTAAQAIFGNYMRNPHCFFEARSIPGSQKLIFTASGHHAMTGGCLVLLDPNKGADAKGAMTRLTPEVCFPEAEGWPQTYYVNPYPLSENHYLTAWSGSRLPPGTPRPIWSMPGPINDLGVYLFDAFGNLELIYRDPEISSMYPLPIRGRQKPPVINSLVDWQGRQESRMMVLNVYEGLESVEPGTIDRLRLVGVPVKTHPTMNYPVMGVTADDPGKFVMGTVPVEEDGSAYFRAPSGVAFFMQALDQQGMAVQTMRSATYLQPGQSYTCIGCHEHRNTAPPNIQPLATLRPPSKITPGVEGSWPLDYQVMVQPVLETNCVSCHQPDGEDPTLDLTAEKSYDTLVSYGSPSLRDHVGASYAAGRSIAGAGPAQTSALLKLLEEGHYDVRLTEADRQRLITWMDTYAQRLGSFDTAQQERLRELRRRMAPMLTE